MTLNFDVLLTSTKKSATRQEIEEKFKRTVLTKEDREVLKRGFEKLLSHFSETPAKEWPAHVIFLDTTARPLAAATKKLLDKLYAEKNQSRPTYSFLLTFHPANFTDSRLAQVSKNTRERLREIIGEDNAGVLFIDDYCSSGGAYRFVKKAMESDKWRFFAFYKGNAAGGFTAEDRKRIFFGSDEFDVPGFFSFAYMHTRIHDPQTGEVSEAGMGDYLRKKHVTGVIKDPDLALQGKKGVVQKSPDAKPSLMKNLREAISDIAAEVIKERHVSS